MRCGVYTRFSSDQQHPASIEDQRLACQRYAERQSWQIIPEHIYADAGFSGMGVQHRPSYQRLLRAIENVPLSFDILLVDDLSRLSRDAAEILRVVRLLQDVGIKLISVADGIETGTKLSKLALSVKAIINEVYLDDLRDRTLRGMHGRFSRGLHTGGRIYGYRSVPVHDPLGRLDAGGHLLNLGAELVVETAEADIVRTIFAWFAQGVGLRTIASRLNTQACAFPGLSTRRGLKRKGWASSAVRVILKNEKYRGQWVWGRRVFSKDPLTGRRRARMRPASEWHEADYPQLRIVSEDLWNVVQGRFQRLEEVYSPRLPKGRLNGRSTGSPSFRGALFSGLLTCTVCGGGLVVVSGNLQLHNGRYGCGFHRNKGEQVCANGLTVKVTTVETQLVTAIRDRLFSPGAIQYLVEKVNALMTSSGDSQEDGYRQVEGELLQVEHDLKNIEKAILAGVVGETTGVLLRDREAKRNALRQQLERWQQREKVSPYIPISAEAIRARLEGLDELLRRDPCRVNAFFRDHLSPIRCEPVQEAGQRFYRASGAMKGSAFMTALGLEKEFVFGGCGGRI